MTTKRENAKKLYEKFFELAKKTRFQVHDYVPGKPIITQHIEVDDVIEREEIRQQLIAKYSEELRDMLSPHQLIDLGIYPPRPRSKV